MEHQPTLHVLIRLHSELGFKIQENEARGRKLTEDMLHIEAVIRMLDPDFRMSTISPRRRNNANPWFKRGAYVRYALTVLRKETQPLTSRQVTDRIMEEHGPRGANGQQLRVLVATVHRALMNHEGRTVKRTNPGVIPARWALAEGR